METPLNISAGCICCQCDIEPKWLPDAYFTDGDGPYCEDCLIAEAQRRDDEFEYQQQREARWQWFNPQTEWGTLNKTCQGL